MTELLHQPAEAKTDISTGVGLGRGMMCRYVEEAGNALGATIVHAMWQDTLENGCIISTDATSALVQPLESKGDNQPRQACKKAHFFTAVVDADHVLFAYAERYTHAFVQELFQGFSGFLQCDAHSVYDILERGPPREDDEGIIASSRLHAIDPQQYLDEVLRVLPHWPEERYLKLVPKLWATTRARLRADELAAPTGAFTIPAA